MKDLEEWASEELRQSAAKKELDKDFVNLMILGIPTAYKFDKDGNMSKIEVFEFRDNSTRMFEVTIGDFSVKRNPDETEEQFKTRLQIELDNNGFDVEVV